MKLLLYRGLVTPAPHSPSEAVALRSTGRSPRGRLPATNTPKDTG